MTLKIKVKDIDDYEYMWHYCPNCGAKMDGKEVEGE